MFHTEIFSSSIASGAFARQQVTYFSNTVLPPLNLGAQVSPEVPYLMALCGIGASIIQVQPQTPAFQPGPYPNFNPNNRGTAAESPVRFWDFSMRPLPMNATDEIDIFASQNLGAPEVEYIGVWFSNGPPQPGPAGRVFFVHWTQTITALVGGALSQVAPTLDASLPAGTYMMVGARTLSATALFFQIKPAMGAVWRPGGVAVQAYDSFDPVGQYPSEQAILAGNYWGPWISFQQNVPPTVVILATANDATQEGWYALYKIA